MGDNLQGRVAARRGGNGADQAPGAEADRTLEAQIKRMAPEYDKAMPKGMEAAQLVRDGITCLRTVRKLDQCEPASILGALMTCAQLGLRPAVLGLAWPLPFWDPKDKCYKAQLVIGYQGYIELGHRSGRIKDLTASVVYREDPEFDYWLDEQGPHLIHRPLLDGMRENVRSFFSMARLVNGGFQITEPMSLAMMERHRDDYAPRDRNQAVTGPWATNLVAMGRKTMVLRNYRLLPKSPEMSILMNVDGAVRVDLDPKADAAEVSAHVIPGEVVHDSPPPGHGEASE